MYEYNVNFSVYDISGKLVLENIIEAGTDIQEINTESLIAGNYISKFYNKEEIIGNVKFTIIKTK